MSPVEGLPGTPVDALTRVQDLRNRFAKCEAALSELDVEIGASTCEMSRLARQDPVSERIGDVARKGQEKLGKLKDLEAEISQAADEFRLMPHPQTQPEATANHARLGADLSEALMKSDACRKCIRRICGSW